jgi:hypothetical protein
MSTSLSEVLSRNNSLEGVESSSGGYWVPAEFARDLQAAKNAWDDYDFLSECFPTTLMRYTNVERLAQEYKAKEN